MLMSTFIDQKSSENTSDVENKFIKIQNEFDEWSIYSEESEP